MNNYKEIPVNLADEFPGYNIQKPEKRLRRDIINMVYNTILVKIFKNLFKD